MSWNDTRKQLSKKIGISSQSIEKIEKSEASDTISLKTLRNAAAALDCRLVYVLIPKEPLQKTVEKQIIKKATNIADTISHSMKLEDQGTS
ncbi:helix-turn-helix domain-containing protein [Candidatus Paracaedibacter symbiosus]|uniref:helix-turn-helix domain-containing protein n=1 Tax=Candidatus Paracaedibacter symbiosus TaxID=244582 RepID=UPI000A042DAB